MHNIAPLPLPIRVGIVGLGRAGWKMHLRAMRALPGFQIVAVADPLPERRDEAFELTGCQRFASIDELLQAPDLQLVVVATPSSTHYADIFKVLSLGLHCIAEKPLAFRAEEAENLVSLARQNNVALFVHHTHLHKGEFYHLQSVLESGLLGKLFLLRLSWTDFRRRWDWQTLKKNGGGILNNTGSHALTILLPLLKGRVTEAFVDMRNIKDAGDAEDHVHALLRTSCGTTVDFLISSAIALDGPKWLLCGSSGTLVCDGKTSTMRSFDPAQVPDLQVLDTAAPGREYQNEELPWVETQQPIGPAPVPGFHENVLDVLHSGADPVVTPESAAEVVRVLELIAEAARV